MTRIPGRSADLDVVVYGDAKTKGSIKSFIPRRGDGSMVTRPNGQPMVVSTNDAGEPAQRWSGSVSAAVAERMQDIGMATIPAKVPVVIELVFYRPRPAAHYGSGRNSDILKASAPSAPSTRPDVDKQTRLILDALKGIAWIDDGQVTGALTWKAFGTPARAELRLWQLPAALADVAGTERDLASSQNALFAA